MFIGLTTTKKITAAITMNEITVLMNEPYRNWLLLIVNLSEEKSGCPPIAAMIGVMMSVDQGGHHGAKRRADHDRDRQIDDIASHQECP